MRRLHWLRSALLAAVLLASLAGCPAQGGARFATIKVRDIAVRVEIADTPRKRATGLMHRDSLPADEGMLFVWNQPQILSFWMKNTNIPLSVAFIDARMKIIRIADMAPHDERSHDSISPARFALEMNQGWFAKKGVKAGDQVWIPEDLR